MFKTIAISFVSILISLPCQAETITIKIRGSTTVSPFIREAASEFSKANPNYNIIVDPVPTSEGVQSLREGNADLALASKTIEGKEAEGLESTLLGWDGMALVVHMKNPLKGLSKAQAIEVFCGKSNNWKEVGGNNIKVTVLNRGEKTGTSELFNKYFKCTPKGEEIPQTGAILYKVEREEGAISYTGLGNAFNARGKVKILILDGKEATKENVISGIYPIKRELLVLRKTNDKNPAVDKFLKYVLDSREKLFPKFGFIPPK